MPNPIDVIADEENPFNGEPEHDCAMLHKIVRRVLLDATKNPRVPPVRDVLYPFGFVIAFNGREWRDKLLADLGLAAHGDKYLDGHVVAAVLGIELERDTPWSPPKFTAHKEPSAGASGKFAAAKGFKAGKLAAVEEVKAEVGEALQNIRSEEKNVAKYIEWTGDMGFWSSVCFRSQECADRFLRTLGVPINEKRYMWGDDLAARLGITLPPFTFKYRAQPAKEDTKLCALVQYPYPKS